MSRVGQNRIYTPYMTVYLMISLTKIPYIHRIYGSGQPYTWASCCIISQSVSVLWAFSSPISAKWESALHSLSVFRWTSTKTFKQTLLLPHYVQQLLPNLPCTAKAAPHSLRAPRQTLAKTFKHAPTTTSTPLTQYFQAECCSSVQAPLWRLRVGSRPQS